MASKTKEKTSKENLKPKLTVKMPAKKKATTRRAKENTEPRAASVDQGTVLRDSSSVLNATQQQQETPVEQIGQERSGRVTRSATRSGSEEMQTPVHPSRRRSEVFNLPGRTPARTLGPTTPFRTPRLRPVRLGQVPDFKAAEKKYREDFQQWMDELNELLKKSLKVCYLSSVRNFKYKEKHLRSKYEKTLANKVQEVFPAYLISAKITMSSCLSLKPNTVDLVRIEVTSHIPGLRKDEDRLATIYSAWMFRTTSLQSANLRGTEWFPVMLYTGREQIHYAVIEWLQGSFGCYVTKYAIQRNDLLWMAGAWSGGNSLCPVSAHNNSPDLLLHLTYSLMPPGRLQVSKYSSRWPSRLTVKLPQKDIKHIWNSIVDSSSSERTVEELCEFFSLMEKLVHKLTRLPSSMVQLHQLRTPCVALSSDGKVRLTCRRSAGLVVKQLGDMLIQTTTCTALHHLLMDAETELEGEHASMEEEV